ncbi:CHAP domain-containing protein [Agrococcus jenensis]|uniref:CHAP domain-containing protein n=1 Tax=Agrococcus jenensis TaxID=46353 RepID=A0A3N2APM1_9MICO|nr:CHAP domain-containing protein [Agrococcus jenensis]ROR64993.1 CHAP domain-containing protein [Agrococcus jenensis]
MITFAEWLEDVEGKEIDNSAGQPHPQCTDLVRDYYMRVLGAPWGIGHVADFAWQWWTEFETDVDRPSRWLQRVAGDARAQWGDVAIWSAAMTRPQSESGHVAVVERDRGPSLDVMNQNFMGHRYSERSTIRKRHLLGYLRPIQPLAGAPGVASAHDSKAEGELTMSEAAEIRAEIAALRDHLDNLLSPGGRGRYSWGDVTVDELRAMVQKVDDASKRLDETLAYVKAIREGQIAPGQYSYDQAILALVQGLTGSVGRLKARPALDVDALAAQLKDGLGADAASDLAKRLSDG